MSGNLLGVGPIGWVNDDLRDWGADRDGRDVLEEISGLGFHGTEMSYRFPQDPDELRSTLAEFDLVLAAAYRWTNFTVEQYFAEEVTLAKAHVDFCKAAGARFATLAEGGGSQHWDRRGPSQVVTRLDERGWELLQDGLHQVGDYARKQGVRLSIHPHGGTAVESADEVDRLLTMLNPELVGYCFDSGHALYGGADPGRLAGKWAHRISYVHLKDVRAEVLSRARAGNWDFATAVRNNIFCTPGAGMIDFDPIMAVLKQVGYGGWLVIEAEQDPSVHDAREVSGQALELLRDRYGLSGRRN